MIQRGYYRCSCGKLLSDYDLKSFLKSEDIKKIDAAIKEFLKKSAEEIKKNNSPPEKMTNIIPEHKKESLPEKMTDGMREPKKVRSPEKRTDAKEEPKRVPSSGTKIQTISVHKAAPTFLTP